MTIRSITVQSLGRIDSFSLELDCGLNIIKSRYTDEVAYALGVILNHRSLSPLPDPWVGNGAEITAEVAIAKKRYTLRVTRDGIGGEPKLAATDEAGIDATAEYLYLSAHSAHQDEAERFDGKGRQHHLRFYRYLSKEYDHTTPSPMQNKTFRACLEKFARDFAPETLRRGKPYKITLNKDKIFSVQGFAEHTDSVYLSDSERVMFGYLCFLKTAEFWCGFEELRNLHAIKKPLLIENFLDRLDESADTEDLLRRTARLNRQIIILSI